MKLFLFVGTATDDITTSLDWLVVANDFDRAKELWTATVADFLDRDVKNDELSQVRILIEDVSALPIGAKGERSVDWEELEIVFKGAA